MFLGTPLSLVFPSLAKPTIALSDCSILRAGLISASKTTGLLPAFQKRCAVPSGTIADSPLPSTR